MSARATGGTETTDGAYTVHRFTADGNFEVLDATLDVDYLVVAGGGGGGGADAVGAGGGGGAGGAREGSTTLSQAVHAITVGGAGSAGTATAKGGNGGASSIGAIIVTVGGGGGGSADASTSGNRNGATGGSGGGAARYSTGETVGSGTSGEGEAGGLSAGGTHQRAGGGGGGKGSVGSAAAVDVGGNGGTGLTSSISGSSLVYAAGGGGGAREADTAGQGTTNVSGNGGAGAAGSAGSANRGGGGGGGGGTGSPNGGAGGTGVVIIRYLTAAPPAVTFDASTKTIAAGATTTNLVVTASPAFAGAITKIVSPGGDEIAPSGTPTSSGATFPIPGLDEFASGQDMNNTRLGQAGTWTVYATAETATASLTLNPPSGYFLRTLTATTGAIPVDIGGTEDIGDDILVWGTYLTDVDTLGDYSPSNASGTANYRWYDVSGSAWQADGSDTYGEPVVLTASTDSPTYYTGTNITIALDPDDSEAATELSLGGVDVIADYTADVPSSGKAGGVLAGPVLADFLEALGTFNAVPWFTFLDLVVGFASAADSTANILFLGPSGANVSGATYWSGQVGADAGGIFDGEDEGTPYLIEVTSGGIASVGRTDGVVIPTESGGADLWLYVAGAWTEQTPITFTYYPPSNDSQGISRTMNESILIDPLRKVAI